MEHRLTLQKEILRLLRAANIEHLVSGEDYASTRIDAGIKPNSARPYINLSSIDGDASLSTATSNGYAVLVIIHAWTEDESQEEVNSLLSQISTALTRAVIVIPNAKVVYPRVVSSEVRQLEGGAVQQGVFRLRLDIYNNAAIPSSA